MNINIMELQKEIEEVENQLTELFEKLNIITRTIYDSHERKRIEKLYLDFIARLKSHIDKATVSVEEDNVLTMIKLLFSLRTIGILWGKLHLLYRDIEIDDFGYEEKFSNIVRKVLDIIYKHYFRVELKGLENLPDKGNTLLVCNHSGIIPFDALMLQHAIYREHASHRVVRILIEDTVYHQPFIGPFITRLGWVRASSPNAIRLLNKGETVVVFPEGILGAGKLFSERYRLQRFGRGGYIKVVLKTGATIIPVAIIGAEEIYPLIYKLPVFSNIINLPFFPVTPLFPLLGPLGLIPLPTKWRIVFGEPISFTYAPDVLDNRLVISRLNEQVRSYLQAMITEELRSRKGIFF